MAYSLNTPSLTGTTEAAVAPLQNMTKANTSYTTDSRLLGVGSCILGPVFAGHSYTGLQCAVNMQTPRRVYNLRVVSNSDRVSLLLTSCPGSLMSAGKTDLVLYSSHKTHMLEPTTSMRC
ncbi:Hypothetical predicted protein [Scomber scombrus]|uniref:Uncharacterized protein n=1 Tax=Scomber scombrus TaxID=13677 RepID=A0AAV1PUK7_SCOSC